MGKPIEINSKNYVERDASWISFNRRVLYQATRKNVPLLERLRFIAICTSNLDEFIRVRFASHMGYKDFDKLRSKIIKFKRQQEEVYEDVMKEVQSKLQFKVTKYKNLDENNKKKADNYFGRYVRDYLVPMTYSQGTKFPHINSSELYALIGIQRNEESLVSIISLKDIDRVVKLSDGVYIMIEEIVFNNLHKIYGDCKFYYKGLFKLNRSASMEMDPRDTGFIVDKMKEILNEREFSIPVFMDVMSTIPKDILDILGTILNITREHIYVTSRHVDLSYLMSIPFIGREKDTYKPFSPSKPNILSENTFKQIRTKDILLHHPYESFNPVVDFLYEAANDDKVIAIRQTLYRVSSLDSPIVEALCLAAQKGKQVSVMIEIKARFDEHRNIAIVDKLTTAGCQVIYGVEQLKTHCKFSIVVRREKKGLKSYAHIGTGNYNDKTAKIYTDLSLFTANQTICGDLISIFNILSGSAEPEKYIKLIKFAPVNLRKSLYTMIDNEIANARKGKKAKIIIKVNSISDRDMVAKLYEASEAGVIVEIICRGVCSMVPINKNIRIKSIIGRFLEHSRVYNFHNGGKGDIYISSADLLTRNLDRRIEVLVPLTGAATKIKALSVLNACNADEFNSFVAKKGKYEEPVKGLNIHEKLLEVRK